VYKIDLGAATKTDISKTRETEWR